MLHIEDSRLKIEAANPVVDLQRINRAKELLNTRAPNRATYWKLLVECYPRGRVNVNHFTFRNKFDIASRNQALNQLMAATWNSVEHEYYGEAVAISEASGFDDNAHQRVLQILEYRLLGDINERAWNRLLVRFKMNGVPEDNEANPKAHDTVWQAALKIMREKDSSAMPISDDDVNKLLRLYASTGLSKPTAYWAILFAQVYKSRTHSFTDYNKANQLFVEAALKQEPDSAAAAFNLAVQYMAPMSGQGVDNKRALFWLAHAVRSTDQATELMIDLIERHKDFAPLRPNIPKLIESMAYSLRNPIEHRSFAGLLKARLFNGGGYGTESDQERSQSFYHAVATRDVSWHPSGPHLNVARQSAAQAAATRSLLGIGIPVNVDAAAAYANDLISCCDIDSIHDADARYAAARILKLVEPMRPPRITFPSIFYSAPTIQSVIKDIVARRMTPEKLNRHIESFTRGAPDVLEGCLWLLNEYLANELQGYPNYASSIALLQTRLLGKQRIESVPNQFRYNALDATQRPILGGIRKPSVDEEQRSGFGKFRSVSVTATGVINFAFDPASSNQLPLLVPEDIEVALALAFGSDKPIWPTFSAEPPAARTPTSPKWIPFTAKWTPEWLGHTALGNTLFATDCEAGPLMLWDIANVKIAPGTTHDSSLARLNNVVEKMAAVIPRNYGYTDFLTFKVTAVELTWSQRDDGGQRCAVNNVKVGLHTGTIDERDTRTYNNNTDYATGYRAAIFNANYDLFAEHYPLLERYRQLATLVTALNQLRERGFEPAPPIRRAITETYSSFVRRPAPTQVRQLFY